MATHVCVRDRARLFEAIHAVGSQSAVAREIGVPVQRLNQLVTGARTKIDIDVAARLEDALHVARGFLFVLDTDVAPHPYVDATRTDVA